MIFDEINLIEEVSRSPRSLTCHACSQTINEGDLFQAYTLAEEKFQRVKKTLITCGRCFLLDCRLAKVDGAYEENDYNKCLYLADAEARRELIEFHHLEEPTHEEGQEALRDYLIIKNGGE